MELIIVLAIMGIVSGAIYAVMQMSIRSFSASSKRVDAQVVARMALNEMKQQIGVAKYANLQLDAPVSALPALGGYCFFDSSANAFIVRDAKGATQQYAISANSASNITLYFEPIEPVAGGSEYNSLRITITVDTFVLSTDVFLQNLDEFGGQIMPQGYEIGSELHPAQFIAFE